MARHVLVYLTAVVFQCSSSFTAFVHPGGWHTAANIARIRAKVAAKSEPHTTALNYILRQPPYADYQPNATTYAGRGTGTNDNIYQRNIQYDAHYAYLLMVKWMATNSSDYAEAALRVIDAWSAKLKVLNGTDAQLAAGIYGSKMAQAAELAAYYNPSWANKARAQKMFLNIFYPLLAPGGWYNWGSVSMDGTLSMAVFCDNQTLFNRVVRAFQYGENETTGYHCNRKYNHFDVSCQGFHAVAQFIDSSGEGAESGRDQGHESLELGSLLRLAVTAYNQGTNLFHLYNDRLTAGFEYTAAYKLGNDVPYHVYYDELSNMTGTLVYSVISSNARYTNYPIYEWGSAYFKLNNIAHPYTLGVLNSTGYVPEPMTSTDHPGVGSLTMRDIPV